MNEIQKNSKKTLIILSVIGGLLLLFLIGAVIYFYTIGDAGKKQSTTITACGCYIIDPAVVNDCGDPKRAFVFNINKVSSDQTCTATCDVNQIQENLLNTTTAKEDFKVCTIKSLSDTRCENMILKDGDGKTITGRIKEDDTINIEATFDSSEYKDYIFKINSENVTPDKVEGNKITKQITDLGDSNSIEILATATDSKGDSISSLVCRRVVDIARSGSTSVSSMTATVDTTDSGTKVTATNINVAQLNSENIKVKYSFGSSYSSLTATKGYSVSTSKGTISMTQSELYKTSNFEEGKAFEILDAHTGDLTITAIVYVDNVSIGSASATVTFEDSENENNNNEEEEEEETATESNFTVTKTSDVECVERVDGSNEAVFTVTIKNNKSETDTIKSITDKLPLGFNYVEGSTKINGSSVEDSGLVTLTTVGSSKQIVWQPSTAWSISTSSTMTLSFTSTADTNAITGENMNEVVVNPEEIPSDPSNLTAEVTITVAQDCDNIPENEVPSTGLFDSTISRIIAGILIIATGWFVYTKPFGNVISEMILGSGIYQDFEMTKYKLINPKKYFEEKTLRKANSHSKRKI